MPVFAEVRVLEGQATASADASAESADSSIALLREFERTGRPEPFERFMRRHASMVYATCLKVTRDPHDAEDATQATFLTLASKSRLNGEIRQPEAWLRKVAHRLALDLIRSKKRRVNRENLRSEMNAEAAPLDSHDHAHAGEVKGILNEELAKLPASYRMPLILHYFGGLSRDEMASQLKLKPSTLGVRLHRAREQLRRKLAARGILLPTVALTALLSEVVRQGVCGHMMNSTARQASAIALGHAAVPQMFAASTGVDSLGSLLTMLTHGKLKIFLSLAILGTAISMTSAQVRLLIPEVIRNAMPSIRLPSWSLPKLDLQVPMPRLAANAGSSSRDDSHNELAERLIVRSPLSSASDALFGPLVATAEAAGPSTTASAASAGPSHATLPVAAKTTVAATPASSVTTTPNAAFLTVPATSASPGHVSSAMAAQANASATVHASSPASTSDELHADATPTPAANGWGEVIAAQSSAGGGGGGGGSGPPPADLFRHQPASTPLALPQDVPARVVAAVTGSVPALRDSNGNAAGRHTASAAPSDRDQGAASAVAASIDGKAKPSRTAKTVVFNGTSANYGGYSDESWKPTQLNQVASLDSSSTLSHLSAGEATSATSSTAPGYSFNYPVLPGETLSINGARATLNNAAGVDQSPATISFVDATSSDIPALPSDHHFIDVWQLDTTSKFTSVDLLVRYDDLRAARLNLNERILKLWVSDGNKWSLLWRDPTFGRDIDQNLLWVTAGSDVKFFAASAPEPATIAALLGVAGVVTRRRRRRV